MRSDDFKLDILVASNIGTLKHVEYDSRPKSKRKVRQLRRVADVQKGEGVTCATWFDDEQTRLIYGRRDGVVATYDSIADRFENSFAADREDGRINSIAKRDDLVLAGLDSGIVKIWNLGSPEASTSLDAEGKLDRMRLCAEDGSIVATGGNENDLKIWDIEKKSTVFRAKNVPHDWLQLRVPIWVSDICFLPDSDGKIVSICSRYGVVRLYDTRAQRRPVASVEMEGQAASCISNAKREKHVLVGTGRGLLNLVDLRMKGKLDKSYKDAVGAITDVKYHIEKDLVISTSLDRHLRIYKAESKELIYKQYLTSKLTCFVVKTVSSRIKLEESEEQIKNEIEDLEIDIKDEASDQEYEDMFKNMEVIRDGLGDKGKAVKNENIVIGNSKKKNKKRKIKNEIESIDSKEERKAKKAKPNAVEDEVSVENVNDQPIEEKINRKVKRIRRDSVEIENDPQLEESIKKLLKSTEKQKRKLEKKKKEKRAKSLFFR